MTWGQRRLRQHREGPFGVARVVGPDAEMIAEIDEGAAPSWAGDRPYVLRVDDGKEEFSGHVGVRSEAEEDICIVLGGASELTVSCTIHGDRF